MVKRVLFVVQLFHLLQQLVEISHLRGPRLDPIPGVLHPEEAILIGANLPIRIIRVVKRVLFVVQALDLLQQVFQLRKLGAPCPRPLPCMHHPKEAFCIMPHLTTLVVHMVQRKLLVVEALHLFQQVKQLLTFRLPGLGTMACVLHPKQPIRVAADLALVIVHVVVRILLIVQDLDLLEQVLQFVRFGLRPHSTLPCALHPQEAVGI
mmetsp:Transcript_147064/g.382261  ORF Transcript_147064/g.382261 Transcript_147064/m.382261 type:complete len:207 (+) Transcript_147064:784-1404(+)